MTNNYLQNTTQKTKDRVIFGILFKTMMFWCIQMFIQVQHFFAYMYCFYFRN